MAKSAENFKVFYDGACYLCSTEINHYRKRNTSVPFEYIDISSLEFNAADYGLDAKRVNQEMHIQCEDGKIRTGAGARLKQIVSVARAQGIGGLEFMEGIPGAIGGAMRMNAGAMESWTFEVVESVRVMDRQGKVREVPAGEFEVVPQGSPLDGRNCRGSGLKGQSRESGRNCGAAEKIQPEALGFSAGGTECGLYF